MNITMFQYCPSCGKKNIKFNGKKFQCPDCGFTFYHNTAAATACVIQTGEGKLVLLVRGREPSLGKLALPGGFVDPGEGVLEGMLRELREELNWTPPVPPGVSLPEFFTLFASFPNIYPYKNIVYNTCDMFFSIKVPGLAEKDLCPAAGEITKIRFMRLDEIDPGDLAFDSTRRAISAFKEFSGRN